jgi:hypothetical protein
VVVLRARRIGLADGRAGASTRGHASSHPAFQEDAGSLHVRVSTRI